MGSVLVNSEVHHTTLLSVYSHILIGHAALLRLLSCAGNELSMRGQRLGDSVGVQLDKPARVPASKP